MPANDEPARESPAEGPHQEVDRLPPPAQETAPAEGPQKPLPGESLNDFIRRRMRKPKRPPTGSQP